MNERWDLGILYKGFDDEAFAQDMQRLDACIADYNALAAGAAGMPHAQLLLPKLPVLISALWPPLLLVLIECRGKLRLFAGAGLAAGLPAKVTSRLFGKALGPCTV